MFYIRKASARGQADHGWLKSAHTFSFGSYHDPAFSGFGPLRVINDDRVAPGQGFGTHGHSNMEIISYVLDGALAHKDSMGFGSTLKPGFVQRLSAGTGITHSEFNASAEDPVHFLQIWIVPDAENVEPRYDEKDFSFELLTGEFHLAASKAGRDGSLAIHQDLDMLIAGLRTGAKTIYPCSNGRQQWVHLATGSVKLKDKVLKAGDGVAVKQEQSLEFEALADSEVLIFDMPEI